MNTIVARLVSYYYLAYKPLPPPLDISPSVYKATKNPLRSFISPVLITGILRYSVLRHFVIYLNL